MSLILLQGIYDANNIGIYHALTTEIPKEKKEFLGSVSHFPFDED